MNANIQKKFCIYVTILFFVTSITTVFNIENDFAYPESSCLLLSIDDRAFAMDNTTDILNDNCHYQEFVKSSIHVIQLSIFHLQSNSKTFMIYFIFIYAVASCMILKNRRYLFGKNPYSLCFLPHFLLQLQIIHKFDGKYRNILCYNRYITNYFTRLEKRGYSIEYL